MTPLDMNKKIAKALGFQIKEDNNVLYYGGYDHNMDYCWCLFLKDYTTDKALCWDLMDMLGEAGWKYSKVDGLHCWVLYSPDESMILKYSENESLLLATCEAFIEEFCDEQIKKS